MKRLTSSSDPKNISCPTRVTKLKAAVKVTDPNSFMQQQQQQECKQKTNKQTNKQKIKTKQNKTKEKEKKN